MMMKGHFVVVFNYDTVLCTRSTLDDAQPYAETHSLNTPRGHYEIFQLGSPVLSGRMGDKIAWKPKRASK